jgi:hypothetical protein
LLAVKVPEELADYAEVLLFFDDFGAGRDGAEFGVDDDLFYEGGLRDVFFVADGASAVAAASVVTALSGGTGGAGQVDAGDLEAVEEEAGATGVDVVGGDAAEDLADGGLDGGAVLGVGQVEGGAAAAALARVGDRAAGGVVVVAELFLTEAWAGAAASVGEDVAALVLLGCFGCVLHGPSPRGTFLCKVFERKEMSPDFRLRSSLLAAKCEGPAFWPGLFLSTSILSNRAKLKCQFRLVYFWRAGASFWVVYGDCAGGFQEFGGLTCEFGKFLRKRLCRLLVPLGKFSGFGRRTTAIEQSLRLRLRSSLRQNGGRFAGTIFRHPFDCAQDRL